MNQMTMYNVKCVAKSYQEAKNTTTNDAGCVNKPLFANTFAVTCQDVSLLWSSCAKKNN